MELDGEPRRVPAGRLSGALSLLLVHAGKPVGDDALAEAMWGNGSPRTTSTLDSHVFRLRRVLEPGRRSGDPSSTLVREAGGYRLVVATDQVDSLRFARLAVDAADLLAQGAPERALRRTTEALASWRGRPYGDAADAPWTSAAVARLDELREQLRETHIGALLATGATEPALAELEIALAEHPLRERLWAHRMVALRDSGRRADALAAYTRARTTLVDELGVEPGSELRSLHASLLADDAPAPARPLPATRAVEVHLPVARQRLIGRDAELATLTAEVGSRPLVTLTGPAGGGKTRLAVETARRGADVFPDGIRFVDLTSATADRVLDTVCSAVELPPPVTGDAVAGLCTLVRDRRMLLVLDNCEHVVDAAAELVEQLLAAGPELAILATSREPLEVVDEHVHVLDPLGAPAAAELLRERLREVTGSSAVAEGDIAGIVAAVDGLPLALELAAGRARAYSLAEIAAQVRADASSLSRIGRGRASHHATIRGAVDTSYRALAAPEAALHQAAGVVPGPFTADLAAALTGAGPDVVAGLVHRSLLTSLGPARPGGASRFAQLATVRGHALHLGEPGHAARDAWVARLVHGRPPLGSTRTAAWYHRVDDDLAAVRATLQRTVVDEPSAAGMALVARLGPYWAFHGLAVEGRRWARTALAAPGSAADRAVVHVWVGGVLLMQSQPDEGRRMLHSGLEIARRADPADVPRLCGDLAVVTGAVFRSRDAGSLTAIADTVAALARDDPALDVVRRHAAVVAALVTPGPGLLDRLTALHADARADDNLHSAFVSAVAAAQVLLVLRRPAEALTWAHASVTACVELGLGQSTVPVEVLGCALALTGDHAGAARAFAVAEADNARGGMPWPTTDITAGLLDATAAALGPTRFHEIRASAAGATLADLTPAPADA